MQGNPFFYFFFQQLQTNNTIFVFDLQPKVKKVKKVAPAPYTTSKPVPKKVVNPLIEKRPRNFGIGKNKNYIINLLFLLNAFAASQNYYK